MPTPEQPSTRPDARARRRRADRADAGRRRHHRDRRGRDRARDPPAHAKGLGFAAWLSIGWMAFVVGGAILAPVPPARRPEGDHHRDRPARPVRRRRHRARAPARRRLQRPRHALAAHLGRSHDAGRRHRSRCSSASCSAACSACIGGYFRGKVDVVVEPAARRVPRHPRGDPRAGAGHHPAHATGRRSGQAGSTPRSR